MIEQLKFLGKFTKKNSGGGGVGLRGEGSRLGGGVGSVRLVLGGGGGGQGG